MQSGLAASRKKYWFEDTNKGSAPIGSGFGRVVSRILSAPLRTERIICLSDRYPEPVPQCGTRSEPLLGPLFGLAPDGVFRALALALEAVVSYSTFSPLPRTCARGGLSFCGTFRRWASRHHRPRVSQLKLSYAASRSTVFGLSSPDLRQERFSTLPKPIQKLSLNSRSDKGNSRRLKSRPFRHQTSDPCPA